MTDKKITRRKVRHPRDFGDRELFRKAFTHWIPSEKVDALYTDLQGDLKKVYQTCCCSTYVKFVLKSCKIVSIVFSP